MITAFLSLFLSVAYAETHDLAPAALIPVAYCESGIRQYSDNKVLESGTHDYGVFQISYQWIPTAKKLGYDIMTWDGNIRMALWLYHKYGLDPWYSSSKCWRPKLPVETG